MSKDTTISFRGSDELKEKVSLLIEGSGLSQKEWYEKAISLAEMNSLKEGAKDYSKDLSELEMHTHRIFELVGNMVKRAGYEKDAVERKLEEVKASQNEVIADYQQRLKNQTDLLAEADEKVKAATENELRLQKDIEQLSKSNANNDSLIEQYKEKIDTLSSLVTEYQAYANENKQLQIEMQTLKEKNRSSIEEMRDTVKDVAEQLQQVQLELSKQQEQHESTLKSFAEKKDLEKEKAILETEKKHQAELAITTNEYNTKLHELYMEIETIRNRYEDKQNDLVDRYEQQMRTITENKKKEGK